MVSQQKICIILLFFQADSAIEKLRKSPNTEISCSPKSFLKQDKVTIGPKADQAVEDCGSSDKELNFKKKMADITDELHELRKENSELKLQLNAAQQAKASLELEIRQKEEVIIKTQAEAINTEQTYKVEIKQLKEKLKENSEIIDLSVNKDFEQELKEAKEREARALAEVAAKIKEEMNHQ